MEEKWSIEKYDGNNWNTWKFQMKHLLMAKGLWCLVDGSEVLADGASEAGGGTFPVAVTQSVLDNYIGLTVLSFTWSLRAKNLSKPGMP